MILGVIVLTLATGTLLACIFYDQEIHIVLARCGCLVPVNFGKGDL